MDCHISLNRTHCVDHIVEQENHVFIEQAKVVLKRDKYACQFCGFRHTKYQQVITRNHQYTNNDFKADNMVTVCPFCFLGQRLGHAVLGGKISFIYLPELSQADLNHLQRILYYYIDKPDVDTNDDFELTAQQQSLRDCKQMAESLGMELQMRTKKVKQVFHHLKLDRLEPLATLLFQNSEADYQKRHRFFEPIRYLVNPELVKTFNDIYKEDVFVKLDGYKEILSSAQVLSREV
ncbi:hypothetical protein AAFX24_28470 [Vibrio mediterranei]|uniref:hypothetical protein n=1 Tax=Vibrio mediterranei TaxID=689 RepID=UPI0038CF1518